MELVVFIAITVVVMVVFYKEGVEEGKKRQSAFDEHKRFMEHYSKTRKNLMEDAEFNSKFNHKPDNNGVY